MAANGVDTAASAAPPPTPIGTLPPFPPSAWRALFGTYRDLIGTVSECPLPFHFANLLSIVAAELGDVVRLHEGATTHTNFFIFCCGRTGTKKSTASDLVQEYIVGNLPDKPRHQRFSSVSSAEGLIRVLSEFTNVLLRYDEIADLFATANRTGQRIEPTLNEAFSLQPLATTVKRRKDSLTATGYYLNIQANGTPDHVRLSLSEALFAGGLLNRFLVFASEPSGVAMPEMGMPNLVAAKEIAARIASIAAGWEAVGNGRGSILVSLSPGAKAVHSEWYHQHTLATQKMADMEAKPLTRLDVYAKKLAAIYCLLETPPTPTPQTSAAQMEAALAVIAYCQASMLWTTRAWTGQQSQNQQSQARVESRIEAYLQAYGCSTERNIYRNLHVGSGDCGRAVTALASMGVVSLINDRPRMVHYAQRCKCFQAPTHAQEAEDA